MSFELIMYRSDELRICDSFACPFRIDLFVLVMIGALFVLNVVRVLFQLEN